MCSKVEQEWQGGVRQVGKPGQQVGGPGPDLRVLIVEEGERGGKLGKDGVVRTHRRVTEVDRIAGRQPIPRALQVPASLLVLLGGQSLLVQDEELAGRPEALDRHLHHLPTAPAQQDTHDSKTETDLTESYWIRLSK
ncbi:hypothetical protein ACFYNZ_20215 [Streptomyces kebangsaanensis]|uniref:Uncharacterized protein n=1 Tax=Streptomyces kebangsaanensis TaxID=864058 RepID=A0ABW6KWN9_9ACTN